MFTHKYKLGFIHGYCDRELCQVQLGVLSATVKSYRAAKLWITRHL